MKACIISLKPTTTSILMTTIDFITELFCCVDDMMDDKKYSPILVQWNSLKPDRTEFVQLSIAEFSL